MSELTRPKLSRLVSSQLPEFIREDYGTFVSFLEAYYEFLQQNTLDDLYAVRDVDKTLDVFLDNFKSELARNFPKVVSDNRFLLHRVKDYYRAKGSDASYKLLFKLLYGKEVELGYPGQQVLRASDGRWSQEVSIFVKIDTGKAEDIVNKKVDIFADNNTTPIKVFVQRFESPQTRIAELFIDRRYFGTINVGDRVKFGNFTATVIPTTVKFTVIEPGTKFKLGQTFNIGIGDSTDSVIKVDKVTPTGGLEKVSFIKYGTGYVYADPYEVSSDDFRQIFDYMQPIKEEGSVNLIDYNKPAGVFWEPNTNYNLNALIYHGNNLYRVTFAGESGDTPPTHTSGSAINGDGSLELTVAVYSYDYKDYFEEEYAEITVLRPEGTIWEANTEYVLSQLVYYGTNLYEVTQAGTTGSTPPSATTGSIMNGTVELSAVYIGYDSQSYFGEDYDAEVQATYGSAFQDDYVHGETLAIFQFEKENDYVIEPEYREEPRITYSNDFIFNISNAQNQLNVLQSTTVISGNSISISDLETDVLEHGFVTTSDYNVDDGVIWEPSKAYSLGDLIYADNRLYEVTVAGTSGTSIPTHTSGSSTNGTLTLSIVYEYYNTQSYAQSGYFAEVVRNYGSAIDASYVGTVIRNFYHNSRLEREDVISTSGEPATVKITVGAVAKYPGYYVTNDGFLDDAIFIQDSKYYQPYSYVVKIDEQLESYKSIVKSLLHPTGLGLFAEYNITNNFDLGTTLEFIYKIYTVIRSDEVVPFDQYDHFDMHKPLNDVQPIEESHTYHFVQYPREDSVVSFDAGGQIGVNVYVLDNSGEYFDNDDGFYMASDPYPFYGFLSNWAMYDSSFSLTDEIQSRNNTKLLATAATVVDDNSIVFTRPLSEIQAISDFAPYMFDQAHEQNGEEYVVDVNDYARDPNITITHTVG